MSRASVSGEASAILTGLRYPLATVALATVLVAALAAVSGAVAVAGATVGAGLAIVGAGLARRGYADYRLRRRAQRAETVPTTAAADRDGPVGVAGTARPASKGTIPAPFSDEPALLVRWRTRERRPTVDEPAHSSRYRHGADVESVPFYVADDAGRVVVHPDDATVELAGEADLVHESVAEADLVSDVEDGTREGYENRLTPGTEVYVHGDVTTVDTDSVAGLLADDPLVTDRSGAALAGETTATAARTAGAVAAAVVGVGLLAYFGSLALGGGLVP